MVFFRVEVGGDALLSQSPHRKDSISQQVDAVHFALGVILTMFIEYIVLARPEYYPYLFYTLMTYMMVYRFNSYRAIKEHFFMLDFWYVYILGCVSQTFQ